MACLLLTGRIAAEKAENKQEGSGTGHIFGFTEGTDIGGKDEKEYEFTGVRVPESLETIRLSNRSRHFATALWT
jgi:hypothetical protein